MLLRFSRLVFIGNRLKDLFFFFFFFEVFEGCWFVFFSFVIEDSICPLLFIPFFFVKTVLRYTF